MPVEAHRARPRLRDIHQSRQQVAQTFALLDAIGERLAHQLGIAGLAQRFLRTDEIFLGLIVIGLIGLLIDLGFRLLMRRTCSWAN